MTTIRADGLADAICDILAEYKKYTLDDMQQAVDETASECLKDIRSGIDAAGLKATGDYRKSWKAKKKGGTGWSYSKVIFSKMPGLPHLLEYGHAKVNGGRVAGRPHLQAADENAANNFIRILKSKLQGGT